MSMWPTWSKTWLTAVFRAGRAPTSTLSGSIDILVNNAGYTNPVPLQQVKMSDFEKTMEVNLYGPFTIVKTLLNRGNTFDLIVNIASTAGINGRSGWLKIGRASCRERR